MPIDRDDVPWVAFAVFVGALAIFYGLVPTELLTVDEAFFLAAGSWVVGYAGCSGKDWDRAENFEKAMFLGSWVILLLAQFSPETLEPYMTDYEPWIQMAAIVGHSLSMYLTIREA